MSGAAAGQADWEAFKAHHRATFEETVCFNSYIGTRLEDAGDGWARVALALPPEMLNPFGAVHGGAIAALIDSSAGSAISAGAAHDPALRVMGTIDMQVHYLERAQGERLVAEARVVRAGKAIAVASVDVLDAGGRRVAIGTATYRLGPAGPPNQD